MDQYCFNMKQTSKYIGVCYQTIFNWIQEGRIPAYKKGHLVFVLKEDLEKFIKEKPKENVKSLLGVI